MSADLARFVFPVTKLEKSYEDKGVVVPKRGDGTPVATTRLGLNPTGRRKATVAALTAAGGSNKKLLAQAERVRECIAGGLELLGSMHTQKKRSPMPSRPRSPHERARRDARPHRRRPHRGSYPASPG